MRISLRRIIYLLGAAMLIFAAMETVEVAITLDRTLFAECAPKIHMQNYPYHPTIVQISSALVLGMFLYFERSYVKSVTSRFSMRDLKRLFLGMVVTGGSIYHKKGKYCIRFYGKDLVLHNILKDLAYEIYNLSPRTVYYPTRGSYVTQLYCKEAVMDIEELSPEINMRKNGVPTISYILDGDRSIRQEALRLMMSVSGWIYPLVKRCNLGYKVTPKLGLGSSYPKKLIMELMTLSEAFSINFQYYSDSRYPGKGYLMTYETDSIWRFFKIGGFIEGCKIKKGRYEGKDKSAVLVGSLLLSRKILNSPKSVEKELEDAIKWSNFELSALLNRIMLG